MSFPVFASGDVLNATDMNAVGLWLVKSQVVGNAVSSVTVTGAFSADYDSYRIIYSGGSQSSAGELRMTLGATGGVVYYSSIIYATWTGATGGTGGNGIAYWNVGSGRPAGNSVCIDIHRPFPTDETWFNGSYVGIDAGSAFSIIRPHTQRLPLRPAQELLQVEQLEFTDTGTRNDH